MTAGLSVGPTLDQRHDSRLRDLGWISIVWRNFYTQISLSLCAI